MFTVVKEQTKIKKKNCLYYGKSYDKENSPMWWWTLM